MSKGSVWKNKDGKTVRRNKIEGQWAWLPREALESPAYRVMSLSGHRILARIQLEHLAHAGKDNGKLPVTFLDFEDYGIHRNAMAPAIREVCALGFARLTQEGWAGNGEWCRPNMFALTHLPTNGDQKAATNDWKRIETMEQAIIVAKAARDASPRKPKTTHIKRTAKAKSPPPDSVLQSTAESVPLSISRVESSRWRARTERDAAHLVWTAPVTKEVFGKEKRQLLKNLAQISTDKSECYRLAEEYEGVGSNALVTRALKTDAPEDVLAEIREAIKSGDTLSHALWRSE